MSSSATSTGTPDDFGDCYWAHNFCLWVHRVRAFPVAAISCFPGQYRLSSGFSQLCCTSSWEYFKGSQSHFAPWGLTLKSESEHLDPTLCGCRNVSWFCAGKCCLAMISVVKFLFCFWSTCCCLPLWGSKVSTVPNCEGVLSVWKLFLLPDSLPGCRSSSWYPLSLFSSLSSPYLIQKTFAWLLGSLEFSASLQKVFCRSCSTCRWILVYLWGTEDDLPILFLCNLEGLPSLPLVLLFI